jgi:hypothetical protein
VATPDLILWCRVVISTKASIYRLSLVNGDVALRDRSDTETDAGLAKKSSSSGVQYSDAGMSDSDFRTPI